MTPRGEDEAGEDGPGEDRRVSERLREAYERAAADEAFMEEMEATTEAFEATLADGLAGGP